VSISSHFVRRTSACPKAKFSERSLSMGKKNDLAEKTFKLAISSCENAVGSNNVALIDSLSSLANFYLSGVPRYDEVVPLYSASWQSSGVLRSKITGTSSCGRAILGAILPANGPVCGRRAAVSTGGVYWRNKTMRHGCLTNY